MQDIAIIGGGPAGLSAAIWSARYLHSTVLVDSGDPRNWETVGINGYLGLPGVRPPELRRPHLRRRLISAAGNFVILAASGVVAGFGAAAMGATLSTAAAPALALFLLSFSFLYSVVPLAFWGSTPGMSWAGLVARNGTTEPLAFGQTVWRWLAGWLVVATAGLLGLVALSGRSLADRLSGSSTFELDPAV